ncbi:MAG TPA: glycosyltransferase family 87 protein [Anaerolineae bacterium]|nr:glycosyltransferase family 87 protein [Anaerolineae bacterium]
MPLSKQTALKIILLVVGVAAFLIVPFRLPSGLGAIDFRPYWSSSYLLAHGRDFSDPSRIDSVARNLTGWDEPFTMHAWFAPTGILVLLPYTLLPFTRAVYYWLLTNIVVVFFSAILIWRNTKMRVWIPLVAAFGFSMTLLSLIAGQVNTLVVFGLALFSFFSELRRDFATGASLVLTTIKPHLVVLTLPLLLLDILWRKQWRVLAGFAGTLVGCALILSVFYPAWPVSFWQLVTFGMSSIRETPTLAGLLVVAGQPRWGKWIWAVGLFFAIVLWWQGRKERDRRTLVDISILAGMIISPVGWSYDQVMLLFPLLRILEWAANGFLARKDIIAVALVLVIADAITFYERVLSPSEVWFFWVPLVVAGVYVFAWQRRQV